MTSANLRKQQVTDIQYSASNTVKLLVVQQAKTPKLSDLQYLCVFVLLNWILTLTEQTESISKQLAQ